MVQQPNEARVGQRCADHDLALASDGSCVLCRREGRRRSAGRNRVLVAIGVVCCVGGVTAMVAHGLLGRRSLPASRPPPAPQVSTEPPAVIKPLAVRASVPDAAAQKTATVLQEGAKKRPRTSASKKAPPRAQRKKVRRARREPTERKRQSPRADQDALAARRRMNRLYRSMALQQAREHVAITVYMAPWCRACTAARRWLREKRIAYREVDIDAGPASAAELRARNPRGSIPTIDIDGQILVGFSPGAISQAIDKAAKRRAPNL